MQSSAYAGQRWHKGKDCPQVVVVEKGRYIKAADLTTLEKDAYDSMYERGGLLMATEDGGQPLYNKTI